MGIRILSADYLRLTSDQCRLPQHQHFGLYVFCWNLSQQNALWLYGINEPRLLGLRRTKCIAYLHSLARSGEEQEMLRKLSENDDWKDFR
jgi:hypothetical protein